MIKLPVLCRNAGRPGKGTPAIRCLKVRGEVVIGDDDLPNRKLVVRTVFAHVEAWRRRFHTPEVYRDDAKVDSALLCGCAMLLI